MSLHQLIPPTPPAALLLVALLGAWAISYARSIAAPTPIQEVL